MPTTNYISTIVKILEEPLETKDKKSIPTVKCRVQSPQFRNKIIISLVFWGKLAQEICKYYRVNDYILIEGYLSLPAKKKLKVAKVNFKKVEITALKVYPFLLNRDRKKDQQQDGTI